MTTEQRIKTAVIRTRVTDEEKELFLSICEKKAINQSELIRQLLRQWMKEQQEKDIK